MGETLIVGGGIAGIGLAGFLGQRGIMADVVEQAEEWSRVGYGIGIWGNGVQMLERLGVAEEARERGTAVDRFTIRGRDGCVLREAAVDTAFLTIHRADLHAAVRSAVDPERIRMGRRVTGISETGKDVEVRFGDGTTERYVQVIGADGVHSVVREECVAPGSVHEAGTVSWSFWLPEDVDVPPGTHDIWIPGTEAFITPINGRGLVNIATRVGHDEADLADVAERIGWMIPDAVQRIDPDAVFYDRNRYVQADTWATPRITLIGDAAHALHPISGMGASLALEDAYVLAEELERGDDAFQRYTQRRRERVARMQQRTRWLVRATFTRSRVVAWLRNTLVRHTPIMEWFLQREGERFGR